jgi:putative ABC transport system permease protein
MMRTGLGALLSHWFRNPLQLFTLLAGLALATALWSGVQAVNSEAKASYSAAAQSLQDAQYARIVHRDGILITTQEYIQLRRAGWQVSPVIEGEILGVRLLGIEPLTAPGTLGQIASSDATISDFLGQSSIVVNAQSAQALRPTFGDRVVLSEAVVDGIAVTDITTAFELVGRTDGFDRLVLAENQPMGLGPLSQIAPDLSMITPRQDTDVGELTGSFHLSLTAFGLLSFAVGIFIVNGAIGLAFEQRRSVFRTLRALGFPLRQLVSLLVLELLTFALIAGVLGVSLGYLIAAALLPDVAATLRGLYGAEVTGTLTLRASWWLSGIGIAILGTLIAAIGALWKMARLPLLATAQPRAWAVASVRAARVQGVLAALLFTATLLLILFGSGLSAGFATLGALLIGAALALPLILDRLLATGAHLSRSVVGQWFWADTRQQLPGLSLALMALLLAMAANVGVTTMVSSFRLTFVGFLDQRLASELYIYANDPAEGQKIETYLNPRVEIVLPILIAETRIAGLEGEVFGARDHTTLRDNWGFLSAIPDAWDQWAQGTGILISEQTARRADLGLGDTVSFADRNLPVAGIYSDYGNPRARALVNEDLFHEVFPNQTATRFGVRTQDATKIAQALITELGLVPDQVVNQARIKEISLGVFERTFTVTGALNVLTLTVAGFAILMSLLTLAGMRLPQLAPIWALGMTRRALGRFELLRAMLLAALTVLLALPLGLALAWVLLAIVNVEAFGWRLPMYLFPFDYARLAVFALIAAALAALWPARKLAKTPPSSLLKVFSNER